LQSQSQAVYWQDVALAMRFERQQLLCSEPANLHQEGSLIARQARLTSCANLSGHFLLALNKGRILDYPVTHRHQDQKGHIQAHQNKPRTVAARIGND